MKWPPWDRPASDEPAEAVANRLDRVAEDLEEATAELRTLVSGLRNDQRLPPATGDRLESP